jgi:hypothetical protein
MWATSRGSREQRPSPLRCHDRLPAAAIIVIGVGIATHQRLSSGPDAHDGVTGRHAGR